MRTIISLRSYNDFTAPVSDSNIYTVQNFIYFPDGRYVIILAVWRTIITNPFTTASNTTISFSNSFSHSTLPECCVLGQLYEFHLVVNRYPLHTLLLYIACIGVWMYNCKSSAEPRCRKFSEMLRIIAIQLQKPPTLTWKLRVSVLTNLYSIHIDNYLKIKMNLNHS